MSDYKRLTERASNGVVLINRCKDCGDCTLSCDYAESALKRLAELEDKIEDGTLINKEVCELFSNDLDKFRNKAKFYYEKCKFYGIENFYDAELEYVDD